MKPSAVHAPRVANDTRRDAILSAATDLFLERGYDGATLDALIERTGGSRRTIYELFGGKEGLLEAMVCQRCAALGERLEELSLEAIEPREMLQRLGLFAAQTMLSTDGLKLYRLLVQESARNPELGRMMYQTGVAPTQQKLEEYFEAQTRAGRLRVEHPADAASIFFGMIKGDLHLLALFWSGSVCETVVRERVTRAVDLFLTGVLPKV